MFLSLNNAYSKSWYQIYFCFTVMQTLHSYTQIVWSCHAISSQNGFYLTLGKVGNPEYIAWKPLTELWAMVSLLWAFLKEEQPKGTHSRGCSSLTMLFKWLLSGLWIDMQKLNRRWLQGSLSLASISVSPCVGQNIDMWCALSHQQLSVLLFISPQ